MDDVLDSVDEAQALHQRMFKMNVQICLYFELSHLEMLVTTRPRLQLPDHGQRLRFPPAYRLRPNV